MSSRRNLEDGSAVPLPTARTPVATGTPQEDEEHGEVIAAGTSSVNSPFAKAENKHTQDPNP